MMPTAFYVITSFVYFYQCTCTWSGNVLFLNRLYTLPSDSVIGMADVQHLTCFVYVRHKVQYLIWVLLKELKAMLLIYEVSFSVLNIVSWHLWSSHMLTDFWF